MRLVQGVASDAPERIVASEEARQVDHVGGLRVVMVVANDVTHDSRVLREAGALAAAGHRVTILGMRTARTTAPDTELRDGFVIRRLPFRARPPGWWVPPDFYGRVRYRAARQYRIHRARVVALRKRAKWRRRSLFNRRSAHFSARSPRSVRPPRELVMRLRTRRQRASLAAAGPGRAIRYVVQRARRTPPWRWPSKAAGLVARTVRRSGRTALTGARLPSRLVARGAWRKARDSSGHGWNRLKRLLTGIAGPIRRGMHAWAGIVTLLLWGSTYIVANRMSRGGLDWMTGWRWRWLGWARFVAEHAPDADVWHGHDMTSLPAIVTLKRARGGIAVYDSHEVYLESARHAEQPRWAKASMARIERELVHEVDGVITVNQSVAAVLRERLDRSDIRVIYNCPARAERGSVRTSRIRQRLGIHSGSPILLYHGSLAPHRGIEELLVAVQRPELATAHLVFLGFGSLMAWLREESNDRRYGGRVHVLDAVPPEQLQEWIRGVDVAVAPIQASTLNHRLSSPNKVFEAISAGVPVAGSDFPEFRRVIHDPTYGPLGEVFDPARPEAIAQAVRRILALSSMEYDALRDRCRRASAMRWNWETESRSLVDLYDGFGSRVAAGRRVRVA